MANFKPKRKKTKDFVYDTTVWNAAGGGFSNPGQSKVLRVGKHKVLLTRSQRLDYYGNPVHTATVSRPDGSFGPAFRSNGSASLTVSRALQRAGIETKKKHAKQAKPAAKPNGYKNLR